MSKVQELGADELSDFGFAAVEFNRLLRVAKNDPDGALAAFKATRHPVDLSALEQVVLDQLTRLAKFKLALVK